MNDPELEVQRLTECLAVRDLRIRILNIDLNSCDRQVQDRQTQEQIVELDQSDQIQKLIEAIADKDQQIEKLVSSLASTESGNGFGVEGTCDR